MLEEFCLLKQQVHLFSSPRTALYAFIQTHHIQNPGTENWLLGYYATDYYFLLLEPAGKK